MSACVRTYTLIKPLPILGSTIFLREMGFSVSRGVWQPPAGILSSTSYVEVRFWTKWGFMHFNNKLGSSYWELLNNIRRYDTQRYRTSIDIKLLEAEVLYFKWSAMDFFGQYHKSPMKTVQIYILDHVSADTKEVGYATTTVPASNPLIATWWRYY